MGSIEKFEAEILSAIEEVAKQHVGDLCEHWIRIYGHGHENESVMLDDLSKHFTTLFETIIKDTSEVERKLQLEVDSELNVRDEQRF